MVLARHRRRHRQLLHLPDCRGVCRCVGTVGKVGTSLGLVSSANFLFYYLYIFYHIFYHYKIIVTYTLSIKPVKSVHCCRGIGYIMCLVFVDRQAGTHRIAASNPCEDPRSRAISRTISFAATRWTRWTMSTGSRPGHGSRSAGPMRHTRITVRVTLFFRIFELDIAVHSQNTFLKTLQTICLSFSGFSALNR